MSGMFNSTASKITGLPGVGNKPGTTVEAKSKALPVLVNTSAERAKAKQREAGLANTILSDTLGGSAGESGAL